MQRKAGTWLSMITERHCLLFEELLMSVIFLYTMIQIYFLKHNIYFLVKVFILL